VKKHSEGSSINTESMETAPQPVPDAEAYEKALGRTIQVLRTERAMSRRDLAVRSSVSYSYLSAIENGDKVPSAKILALIAAALRVHTHELMAAAEARAAENRLGPDDIDIATAEAIDSGLERHDIRQLERMLHEMATSHPPLPSGPTGLPRSTLGAVEELRVLLARMDPRDVELLLHTARRLARPAD
jgi:transcriptional regulator with XRE-family HTH domain